MIKRILAFLGLIVFCIGLTAMLFVYMPYVAKKNTFPKDYTDLVEKYSKEFNLDENYVYAVIKVESSFDPNAKSDAGAIGLMQIIEDSFIWVSKKLNTTHLTFEDMYNPEHSIRYGCFMLSFLYERYDSYELASAAYHAGMTTVDNWLANGIVDSENPNVEDFQGDNTRYYVKKIMRAFDKYSNSEN